MDTVQYRSPLDDDVIDRIMDDPVVVSIIQCLNWASLSKEELDELVSGNESSLDLLIDSHVVVREGDLFRLDVAIQAFGFRADHVEDIREALSLSSRLWKRRIGYLSAYIADSLVSLFFGNEPCWEGESEFLAHRAGLIDENGMITEKGKGCAFAIYSQVSGVFDIRPVDPMELYGKWSSPGRIRG